MKKFQIVVTTVFMFITMSAFAQEGEIEKSEIVKPESNVSFILETHPMCWLLYGANIDAELNFGSPVSFVVEYQNYGSYAPVMSNVFLFGDEYSGNSISGGIKLYPSYAVKKQDSFYLGIAAEYISAEYIYNYEGDYTTINEKTQMTSLGVVGELGWRWVTKSNFTVTFGAFAGFYSNTFKQSGFDKSDEDYQDNLDFGIETIQVINGMINGIKGGLELTMGLMF